MIIAMIIIAIIIAIIIIAIINNRYNSLPTVRYNTRLD